MKTRKSVPAPMPKTPKLRPMTDIPEVAALRDKVFDFENAGFVLLGDLREAESLYARFGQPKLIDHPASAVRREELHRKLEAAYAAKGEECPVLCGSAWSYFLDEFPSHFAKFHVLGDDVIAISEPLEFVLDTPDTALAQRMTPQLIRHVRQAMSHVHPSVWGEEGMGFFRWSVMQLPASFAPALEEVAGWRLQIEAAKQPPPVSKEGGWTLDDLAEGSGVSVKTLQSICKEAGIARPRRGQHSFAFGRKQVRAMIRACVYPNRPAWCRAQEKLTVLLAAQGFAV